jgi:hypothetical protein
MAEGNASQAKFVGDRSDSKGADGCADPAGCIPVAKGLLSGAGGLGWNGDEASSEEVAKEMFKDPGSRRAVLVSVVLAHEDRNRCDFEPVRQVPKQTEERETVGPA